VFYKYVFFSRILEQDKNSLNMNKSTALLYSIHSSPFSVFLGDANTVAADDFRWGIKLPLPRQPYVKSQP